MLIVLSLILTIILNSFLARSSLKFLNTLIDLSIFRDLSSIELSLLVIPLFIIIPTLGIYFILRKFNFDQKLQNMKVVKIIFGIVLTLFVFYIAILLFSSTIRGGGATFAVKVIFGSYILPVIILLLFIAIGMIIYKLIKLRKTTYDNIPLSNKEISLFKYIGVGSIVTTLIVLLNPYGNILKNYKGNNTFQELCKNAKTTIYEEVDLDSIFLYSSWQSRYCKIDNYNTYNSSGGGILPYPRIVIDSNITFETLNSNKKTNNDFKYKYYDNKSEKNYRNGVESKSIKSEYGYIEKQIYNKDSIHGSSVEIFKLDNNKTIAKSIYYINKKTRKVCGDLTRQETYGKKCLKPFYLVLDMLDKSTKD
ncbi:hypothetical protein Arnit_2047 [Arcobacter nitrofigilis DSM 7299]|uniref:Uncharacterized protein n=1 Tax=Arcobacter nitrofigilis (strain ATCC 33309 / DSM 7299 / CCUG 15893 / LMG 7604 / NCTC 12251 / CI) TaxID=572480 RepID=D5V089_ARCNC|nr:hypothetical protein [Arcobacter nitrofigilis]ADG93701.1 hypothetical protein Arnit_2047 [Arcobacter nitrofigilis DSM 7299]